MSDNHTSRYNDSVRTESCYFCASSNDLQTHHIVPQRKNGSDRTENLVIVCVECHDKLERLYDKRFFERLGVSDDRGDERSHFACTIPGCDQPATTKYRNEYGITDWWCDDCLKRLQQQERSATGTVVREVDT